MNFTVTGPEDGICVREYVRRLGLSRRILTRLKQTGGGISVNGCEKTVRAILSAGDVLSLKLEDGDGAENPDIEAVDLGVPVIYEDADLIAFDKPPLMPTHTSYDHRRDTLQNAAAYLFNTRGEPFVFRPVDRLDRDTSGIVVAAKSQLAAYRMSLEMQAGQVHKIYRAAVVGKFMQKRGSVECYIRRKADSIIEREAAAEGSESEYARLDYQVLAQCGDISVLDVYPLTGRTHQIRVQLAYIGHPIAGDTLYGEASPLISRQALHCREISFSQPSTGAETVITSRVPPDMRRLWGDFYDD